MYDIVVTIDIIRRKEMNEVTITVDNFETEVLNSDKPVLIDFWATWCGPCKMMAPVVEDLAKEYAGRIKVGKVNVDDEPKLAIQFGIASIPTFVLMKDGKAVASTMGYMAKEQLKTQLGI